MFNLTGRVAVITGASSGLGRQMSIALALQVRLLEVSENHYQ